MASAPGAITIASELYWAVSAAASPEFQAVAHATAPSLIAASAPLS
jgi:hypothetical protein